MMNKNKLYLIGLLLATILVTPAYAADPFDEFTYSGVLKDDSGDLITEFLDITLRLYDLLTDGTLLWSEVHYDVNIVDGNLTLAAGSINDIGDEVDLTQELYLEVVIQGSLTTITEVESLEHDEINGEFNSLIKSDSGIYILAYQGEDNDGFISTFTISTNGKTITEIASLEHDEADARYNSLVQVDSDTYALAYEGANNDGFIKTFTIPVDGSTITEEESLEHDESDGQANSLVQVDSDTYALAYRGTGPDGIIKTFTISANGETITEEESLVFADVVGGDKFSLVQVDSDTYALAYEGASGDGFISTFTILADGETITEKASLEHDESNGGMNSLVQVDSDTYALAYSGGSFTGFISTFTIPADGSTITEVASLEHNEGNNNWSSLVQVDSDTYILAYSGADFDGFISVFTIPVDGSTITEVGSLEHDGADASYNSLVQVDSNTYALAYADIDLDGVIKTFTISIEETLDPRTKVAATPYSLATNRTSTDFDVNSLNIFNATNINATGSFYLNATNPIHVGSINDGDGGALLDGIIDVYVSGKYAYVTAVNDDTVSIIDISDPTNPTLVGSITDDGSTEL